MKLSNLDLIKPENQNEGVVEKFIDDLISFNHGRLSRKQIFVNRDGLLNVTTNISVPSSCLENGELKVGFNRVEGFRVTGGNTGAYPIINSFRGFPKKILASSGASVPSFSLVAATAQIAMAKTFQDFPADISGSVDLSEFRSIGDFTGCHKHIKRINGRLAVPNTISRGGIGLLLIEDLKFIEISDSLRPDLRILTQIINRHLAQGRDILACQEELIENGLKEYARL